jgi:hypothetical protein
MVLVAAQASTLDAKVTATALFVGGAAAATLRVAFLERDSVRIGVHQIDVRRDFDVRKLTLGVLVEVLGELSGTQVRADADVLVASVLGAAGLRTSAPATTVAGTALSQDRARVDGDIAIGSVVELQEVGFDGGDNVVDLCSSISTVLWRQVVGSPLTSHVDSVVIGEVVNRSARSHRDGDKTEEEVELHFDRTTKLELKREGLVVGRRLGRMCEEQ